MRRAAGLAAIAVVVAIWLGRSRDDRATPPAVASGTPASSPRITPALDPEPPTGAPASLDVARDHVRDAARACVSPHPLVAVASSPDDTIGQLTFRYRVVADGREARVEDVAIRRSTIRDPAVRDCLARRIAGARWPSQAAAGELRITDTLRLGELVARAP